MNLSDQQADIVSAELSPLAVTACAGSGKTTTAVRRLMEMRTRLDDRHGRIALLSFSNVAVDTFKNDYIALVRTDGRHKQLRNVEIDTVDGFISSNVLRPHGHLVMGSDLCPYLVDGREPFLKNYTVWDGKRPRSTAEIQVSMKDGSFSFVVGRNTIITANTAIEAIRDLGKTGAYTHSSARYWVLQILREQPFVLRALVRRYPHVLVDEAQDLGSEHEAILRLMLDKGSQLSLIGDVNQGIYEFSGADGSFLADYAGEAGVIGKELKANYRSVPKIVEIANKLSGRSDQAIRTAPTTTNGAFFLPFEDDGKDTALRAFASVLNKAGIERRGGVVLCRSSDWANSWSGGEDAQGQGVVRMFAEAAIARDKTKNFHDAFKHGCTATVCLLAPEHGYLIGDLLHPSKNVEMMKLRREIWRFIRSPEVGLPSATLVADSEWHPLLLERVKSFVGQVADKFGLEPGANLGNKLARKKLTNLPLLQTPDLVQEAVPRFRVSTVHKVKGESLDAVMYACSKKHAEDFLEGTNSEVGRIGYVALTRARHLFVLAIPKSSLKALEPEMTKKGFVKLAVD